MVVMVVKTESRSFSSAEIQHFRTENTWSVGMFGMRNFRYRYTEKLYRYYRYTGSFPLIIMKENSLMEI
jgi:hypothetical protein